MPALQVVLIEGDGIGPEIAAAVRRIFTVATVPIEWLPARAGLACVQELGTGCPDATLELIRRHGIALKGPTTTPIAGGHASVNVTIRKELDLYANVRQARSLPGVETPFPAVNLVVLRENIEDTYGGIEYMMSRDYAQCLRITTRPGTQRIMRFAFELARQQNRERVVCVHKANIMKRSDGLFLEVFRETAAQFPEVNASDMLVDNACLQLVRRPQQFDLMVMPNLFGDIVSDLAAGLVGGLGVAPSGNIGDRCAVFEAVHGSAPDLEGLGRANPTALLLSAVAMLRHMGLSAHAGRIEHALRIVLESGIRTGDLGGRATTSEFTGAICREVEREIEHAPLPAGERAVGTRIAVPSLPYVPSRERRLLGFDVYLQQPEMPRPPQRLGPFSLEFIGNRGTRLWPGREREVMLADVFRCRYKAPEGAGDAAVTAALAELEKTFRWVHVEKLQEFDGRPGYTEAT